jgi:hypothetical protein
MTPGGCLPKSAICPRPFHVLGRNRCWNGAFEFFDRTGSCTLGSPCPEHRKALFNALPITETGTPATEEVLAVLY